jgi:hypothetical protein
MTRPDGRRPPKPRTVTVGARTPIRGLSEPLWSRVLCLKNQGDIDAQTSPLRFATATHGSGSRRRCLSATACRFRVLLDSGEPLTVNAHDADLLAAMQVSLSATRFDRHNRISIPIPTSRARSSTASWSTWCPPDQVWRVPGSALAGADATAVPFPVEVRSIAADDAWLSPSYQRRRYQSRSVDTSSAITAASSPISRRRSRRSIRDHTGGRSIAGTSSNCTPLCHAPTISGR